MSPRYEFGAQPAKRQEELLRLSEQLEQAETALGELRANFNARLLTVLGELHEVAQAVREMQERALADLEPGREDSPTLGEPPEVVIGKAPEDEVKTSDVDPEAPVVISESEVLADSDRVAPELPESSEPDLDSVAASQSPSLTVEAEMVPEDSLDSVPEPEATQGPDELSEAETKPEPVSVAQLEAVLAEEFAVYQAGSGGASGAAPEMESGQEPPVTAAQADDTETGDW